MEIKKYADSGDIKSLKYIFVDSLDVDPTFARYEEEYNYCKSIPGLLEPHIELTPFSENKADWNEEYWTRLKMDLVKNFSDRRMSHMRDVAQVFLADKIKRILAERAANAVQTKAVPKVETIQAEKVDRSISQSVTVFKKTSISKAELQEREKEEEMRKIAAENEEIDKKIAAQRAARIEQQRRIQTQSPNEDGLPKKVIGIAIAAIIVAVVLFLLLK